jgi:photosystem II stability/assembly factor-like uncharacterized protein
LHNKFSQNLLPMKTNIKSPLVAILLLCRIAAFAQFITPLNGPNGFGNISLLAADSTGAIYLKRDKQIFRSVDGGDTWIEATAGWNPDHVKNIHTFLSLPSGKVFARSYTAFKQYQASTNEWVTPDFSSETFGLDRQGRLWTGNVAAIYVSDDDANTFSFVLNYLTTSPGIISGIAPYSDDHGLFTTVHNQGAITQYDIYHFNKDGQVVPIRVNLNPKPIISYNPHSGTAFYTTSSILNKDTLFRSTDGGLSYTPILLNFPGAPAQLYDFQYEKNGTIWSKGPDGIYRSTDDGITWTRVIFGNIGSLLMIGPDGQLYLSENYCGAMKLRRSMNSGLNWEEIYPFFKFPNVYSIQKDAAFNVYALSCRNNAWEKSPDDGETWTDLTLPDGLPFTLAKQLAFVPGSAEGLAVSELGNVFYTANNGLDWQNVVTPPGTSPDSRLMVSPDGIYYLIHVDSVVFKSIDKGQNWQPINARIPNQWSIAVTFSPDGDLYFSGYGMHKYTAALDTTIEINFNGFVVGSTFHYHQKSGNVFIVAKGPNFGDPSRLIRWNENTGLIDTIPFFNSKSVRHITSGASSEIYISTAYPPVLYSSSDNGNNWQQLAILPKHPQGFYAAPDGFMYFLFPDDVVHRSAGPTTSAPIAGSNDMPDSVFVYPNPFYESVNFEIATSVVPDKATLRLFDATGRQVRQHNFYGNQVALQRQTLGAGFYYFLIDSNGQHIGSGKIIAK